MCFRSLKYFENRMFSCHVQKCKVRHCIYCTIQLLYSTVEGFHFFKEFTKYEDGIASVADPNRWNWVRIWKNVVGSMTLNFSHRKYYLKVYYQYNFFIVVVAQKIIFQ